MRRHALIAVITIALFNSSQFIARRFRRSYITMELMGFIGMVFLGLITGGLGRSNETNLREGKVFSLFNIVKFDNGPCSSNTRFSGASSFTRNGTCLTTGECVSKRGFASGNCASGFGVCCVFLTRSSGSSTIKENCTYLQNPDYPSPYDATTDVQYHFAKCHSDVCTVRLDFEMFQIQGPTGTAEATDCIDQFTVTTTTNQRVPVICGLNTGEHIYLDLGMLTSGSATATFTFTGLSTRRRWDIKVTQIPCVSNFRPPPGCLQWQTGLTGRITSFNFQDTSSSHLWNQQYTHCIRRAAGFCCNQYRICNDANSFTLDHNSNIAVSAVDVDCTNTNDFVHIQGSTNICMPVRGITLTERICGRRFSSFSAAMNNDIVCDCSPPFIVGIRTDGLQDTSSGVAGIPPSRGVCLEYTQIPC